MILGLDASNIRAGGGLTHLINILLNVHEDSSKFEKIIIWASEETLKKLPDQIWIVKKSHRLINKNAIFALLWQIFILKRLAKKEKCDIVFAPGGTFLSPFMPFVTMSQNMLPFELNEAFRFRSPLTRLRFITLRLTQSFSFSKAAGIIFLTKYAKNTIFSKIRIKGDTTIIPHGINVGFLCPPRYPYLQGSGTKEFQLLYVSIITVYKHQWHVVRAVSMLRKEGFNVKICLIGPKTSEGWALLEKVISEVDPNHEYITYFGSLPHDELAKHYKNSDAFIFASTCENQPIILLEAMSAGLPIACSEKQPLPEVLGEAGFYFNAEDVQSIKDALKELISKPDLAYEKANLAYQSVRNYSWKNCSDQTFDFIYQIATTHNTKNSL